MKTRVNSDDKYKTEPRNTRITRNKNPARLSVLAGAWMTSIAVELFGPRLIFPDPNLYY
jgi:hypothetical protein